MMSRFLARFALTPARLQHFGGFALAGLLAFAVDAAILEGLVRGVGLSPYLARLIGISAAMAVSWIVNRTVTFAVRTRPTAMEFAHFSTVSWLAQAVNYGVFALALALIPAITPFVALMLSSFAAMFFSYGGFQYFVFGQQQNE
jgi:putative flippase GtrA